MYTTEMLSAIFFCYMYFVCYKMRKEENVSVKLAPFQSWLHVNYIRSVIQLILVDRTTKYFNVFYFPFTILFSRIYENRTLTHTVGTHTSNLPNIVLLLK